MNSPGIRTAAVVCLLGVGLGAFGAHALAGRLESGGHVDSWETAVFYQLLHGVALFALAISGRQHRGAAWCWLIGVVLFSGSLYGLSLLESARWLGPVTPLGGLSLMMGWLALVVRAPQSPQNGTSR